MSNLNYDAIGQPLQVTDGNVAVTTHTYEPTTLRLRTLQTSRSGVTLQGFTYGYDNVGNVLTITDTRDRTQDQAFTYDALEPLQTASWPQRGVNHTYTYNSIGNLLAKARVTYTYGDTMQTCNRLMPHAVTATSDGQRYI
ncbi:MAG TPA: hypothetical protein VLH58_14205 [Candidatus Methylomirabilis sp.]|nr:hypothetical protein [Candidatus Methylomirabilis sp.]HSC72506.1 hypothetical protein [Candidatus Methylomirabilis sp.]